MILCHCFVRKTAGRLHLLCETVVSKGVENPSPTLERMFEVELPADRSKWADRIKRRICAECPEFEFAEVLMHGRKDRVTTIENARFDVLFRRKAKERKTFLERIGLK